MKLNITFFIIILIILSSYLFPVDIYISKLQAFFKARSETDNLSGKVEYISNQLKKELMRQSSEIITYDDLGGLSQKRRREYDAEPITDTLDALAVCFFYDIEYILYGELYIGGDDNQYRVQMKLYHKATGDVIHTIDYTKAAENDIAFAQGLATTINQELMIKISGFSGDSEIVEDTDDKDRVIDKVRDKLDDSTEDDSSVIRDRDDTGINIAKEKEKVFGIWLSLGYFIQLAGEWKGIIMPTATVEEGVNWAIKVVDGSVLDFYIRPSLLFNYSFSVQDPFNTYHIYVHHHSLTVKANVDFFFEINDLFGFFAGFGPHYKINVIDFRTRSADFFTDIPYAFGFSGNVGAEFSLNKAGTFNLGINNAFDFTFFNDMYIDYKIFTYCIFRI